MLEKETYKKWKSLVNMSVSELVKFMQTQEGKDAGLSKKEADKLNIKSGKESARWILKMKKTPASDWTPTMWEWAKRQISFISRMRGNKGELYDDKRNKTRKHTSLLIWGHNPEKFENGGEVYLLAPNGKPSKLTPQQYKLVRTPEFKAWFGDWINSPETASKAIDKNGEPRIFYHGTTSKINVFKPHRTQRRIEGRITDITAPVFYFSSDKKTSEFYIKDKSKRDELLYNKKSKPYLYQVFLNIRNPFDFTINEKIFFKVITEYYGYNQNGVSPYAIDDFYNMTGIDVQDWYDVQMALDEPDVIEIFKNNNYDSIILEEEGLVLEGETLAIFNSNQIKLADGTNTTFDPNNPDIRFDEGGTVLLAQNGKPSNLTPEQYLIANTHEFRYFFGDWENIGFLEKLLNYDKVFEIIESRKRPEYGQEKHIIKELPKKLIDVGNTKAEICASTYKKMLFHGGKDELYYAIYFIEELCKNSIFFDWEINNDKEDKSIEYFECYFSKAIFRGDEYIVRINLQVGRDGRKIIHDINLENTNPIIKTVRDKQSNRADNGAVFDNKDITRKAEIQIFFQKNHNELRISYEKVKKMIQSKEKLKSKEDRKIKLLQNTYVDNISKIIDENGEPLVVYHGTTENFTVFKYTADIGFHFGTHDQASVVLSKKSARLPVDKFQRLLKTKSGQSGYILPCFLKIINPIETIDFIKWDSFVMAHQFQKHNIFTDEEAKKVKKMSFNEGSKLFVKLLQEKGYDGINYKNEFETKGFSYIAFSSNQIKLADGSNITFAPNDEDIRLVEGGLVGDIYTKDVYFIEIGGGDWAETYHGLTYTEYNKAKSDYDGININDFDSKINAIDNYKTLSKRVLKYKFIGKLDSEYDEKIEYFTDQLDDKRYWELIEESDSEQLEFENVSAINEQTDDVLREVQFYFDTYGGYKTIYLDEEETKSLKLRIKNHSGKWRNKGYNDYFLSIVIAEKDPTEQFHTQSAEGISSNGEFYFDSDYSAEEIIDFINEKIKEFKDEVNDNYSKGGSVMESFKVPKGLEQNFKIKGDFSNINNWQAKIIIGNSLSKGKKKGDWEKVGYVAVSTKDNTIIPISRSDEHQAGYEILQDYYKKYINPQDFISVFCLGNNYIYSKKEINDQVLVLSKLKKWGLSNLRINIIDYNNEFGGDRIFSLNDFIESGGDIKKSIAIKKEKNEISEYGQDLIYRLEQLALLLHRYHTSDIVKFNDKIEEKIFEQGQSFYDFAIHERLEKLLGLKWDDIIKIDTSVENKDISALEQSIFSFNGIKNIIHNLLRKNDKNAEAFFLNNKQALIEFDKLSNLKMIDGENEGKIQKEKNNIKYVELKLKAFRNALKTAGGKNKKYIEIKIKAFENELKRGDNVKFSLSNDDIKYSQGGETENPVKKAYLMTLAEYQAKVTPILQEYLKFIRKNDEYLIKADYNGILYYTYPELLSRINNGTAKGFYLRRSEYDKNLTNEEFARKKWAYQKTRQFDEKYEPKPTPEGLAEKKNEYLEKLNQFFLEEEIIRLIEPDETKSNKRSIKRAIDNGTYNKLLESGQIEFEDLVRIADTVDVKIPQKVKDSVSIDKRIEEEKAELYSKIPKINKDKLKELIDTIDESFRELSEQIYQKENERILKNIELIKSLPEITNSKLQLLIPYPNIFNHPNEIIKVVEEEFYNKYNRKQIEKINFYKIPGLTANWESELDKGIREYIESLKLPLFRSVLLNFQMISEPIKSVSKKYLCVGHKGMEGVYHFDFENGSSFDFETKAITAGGHNIQKFHFRYISDFINVVLKDGTKLIHASLYDINKSFSKIEKMENLKKGGEIEKLCPVGTKVQSIIFKKDKFTTNESEKWLNKYNYKIPAVDETTNYYRYRQVELNEFDKDSIRTIEFTGDIKAIIGCPVEKKEEGGSCGFGFKQGGSTSGQPDVDVEDTGGMFVGARHTEGGIPFVIPETNQHVEVEGREFLISARVFDDKKIYDFEGTNSEILDNINTTHGAKGIDEKATEIHGGDFITCIVSTEDNKRRRYHGSLRQIVSAINASGGCKHEYKGATVTDLETGEVIQMANGGGIQIPLSEFKKSFLKVVNQDNKTAKYVSEHSKVPIHLTNHKVKPFRIIIEGSLNNKRFFKEYTFETLDQAKEHAYNHHYNLEVVETSKEEKYVQVKLKAFNSALEKAEGKDKAYIKVKIKAFESELKRLSEIPKEDPVKEQEIQEQEQEDSKVGMSDEKIIKTLEKKGWQVKERKNSPDKILSYKEDLRMFTFIYTPKQHIELTIHKLDDSGIYKFEKVEEFTNLDTLYKHIKKRIFRHNGKSSVIGSDSDLLGKAKQSFMLTWGEYEKIKKELFKLIQDDKMAQKFADASIKHKGYEKIKTDVSYNPVLAYTITLKSEMGGMGYADTSYILRNKHRNENAEYVLLNYYDEIKKYIPVIHSFINTKEAYKKNVIERALQKTYDPANENPEDSVCEYMRAIRAGKITKQDAINIITDYGFEVPKGILDYEEKKVEPDKWNIIIKKDGRKFYHWNNYEIVEKVDKSAYLTITDEATESDTGKTYDAKIIDFDNVDEAKEYVDFFEKEKIKKALQDKPKEVWMQTKSDVEKLFHDQSDFAKETGLKSWKQKVEKALSTVTADFKGKDSDFIKAINEGRITAKDAIEIIKSAGIEVPKEISGLEGNKHKSESKEKLKKINLKEDWMLTVDEFITKRFSEIKRKIYDREAFINNFKSERKQIITKAIEEKKYQEAINEGKITAEDTIEIIKSAGLEIPQEISQIVKKKPELKQPEKSIFNQDTDLLGDPKESWMDFPTNDFYGKEKVKYKAPAFDNVEFVIKKSKVGNRNYYHIKEVRTGVKLPHQDFTKLGEAEAYIENNFNLTKEQIEYNKTDKGFFSKDYLEKFRYFKIQMAIDGDYYQKAISEGRMTVADAKAIIESANLEVPKNLDVPIDVIQKSYKDVFSDGGGINKYLDLKGDIKKEWMFTPDEFVNFATTKLLRLYNIEEYFEGKVDKNNYPILHKTLDNGIELRSSGEKLKYVKTNDEGEIIRDEKGEPLYMNEEDMIKRHFPFTDTTIHAFDGDTYVGWAANSFGVPELFVRKEYQQKGIGTEILEEHLKTDAYNYGVGYLGQATKQGMDFARGYCKRKIKDALKQRFYQQAILQGRITPSDVKTIIKSAGLEVPNDIYEIAKIV